MARDSNAKDEGATAPQSPIVRHLGLIKAMSVIMAILIIAALVVITFVPALSLWLPGAFGG